MTLHEIKTISIRDAGHDEKWLETHILDNTSSLGLGELDVVANQRPAGGGILDILLRDTDSNTMYEVEVQLGSTDPSHIMRTIEYWSNEKRKWPNRQHYAVLVAENITRRFYDVMQELGHAIPFIAIQVSLVEIDKKQALQFQTLLDTYQEPDDETTSEVTDRKFWQSKPTKKHIVEALDNMLSVAREIEPLSQINYTKTYCTIQLSGRNLMSVRARKQNNVQVGFRVNEETSKSVDSLLDEWGIDYQETKKGRRFVIPKNWAENNKEQFKSLFHQIIKFHE